MCLKAEVCRSEGDLNAAVGHYESARLLDRELSTPRGAYIARELACLYRASSRHAEAARLLEELAKTTDSPGDRELLAWSLLAIGRLDRAAEVVATLNQEEADALTLWLQLAKRHAEHGRLDKAKITVKTALAIDPTDSDALLLDAYLSAQSGDTREAAQALRLLTDTRPDDPLLAPLQEFARRPNASTNR
jgi:tetratricopeptide (TPR) repeat protein